VFARTLPSSETPWVSVLVCCVLWTLCLTLGFQRLIELDVLVYGLSLLLEFVALAVLRVREPGLARPFRVPGGVIGATLLGVPPMVLIATALWSGRHEAATSGGTLPTLALGAMLVAAGPLVYFIGRRSRRWREWSSA
jgi:amino acid transporter